MSSSENKELTPEQKFIDSIFSYSTLTHAPGNVVMEETKALLTPSLDLKTIRLPNSNKEEKPYEYQWFFELFLCSFLQKNYKKDSGRIDSYKEEATSVYLYRAAEIAKHINIENQMVLSPSFAATQLPLGTKMGEYTPYELRESVPFSELLFQGNFFTRSSYPRGFAYLEFLTHLLPRFSMTPDTRKEVFKKVVKAMDLRQHTYYNAFNDSQSSQILRLIAPSPLSLDYEKEELLIFEPDRVKEIEEHWPQTFLAFQELYPVPEVVRQQYFVQQKINNDFLQACKEQDLDKVKYLLTSPELDTHAQINMQGGLCLRCLGFNAPISFELLKYLLTAPELKEHATLAQGGSDLLRNACYTQQLDVIDYVLTSPELKEWAIFSTAINIDGFVVACEHGHTDVIKHLVMNHFEKLNTRNIQAVLEAVPGQGLPRVEPHIQQILKVLLEKRELSIGLKREIGTKEEFGQPKITFKI